ncbi:MAG: MBL fold metallo-hydrolase [Dysgonamonadaceae bacterium]|jgi:glyoxylase-like metal-dependent hydrolase (beta-lactamase superfamily II)|nr:MBL fold metallo-hydrolase [Dysgonamonadaceae bacterium]
MKIEQFEFNPVAVNTYLLYDETGEAALIDCGISNKREFDMLESSLRTNRLTLKILLNTHLHFDHASGNGFIYEKYGVKPQYDKREDEMPSLRTQIASFGLKLQYESVQGEHFIEEEELICFGNTTLKALSTPGHSPGSLSFYSEKDNCVFTGDALFRGSIGRTDLWKGDYAALIRSVKTKLLSLPDETIVYPGHGPSTSVKREKQYNPYINH